MCEHHLCDGPLICTRTDAHTTGHTYTATAGPDLARPEVTDD